MPLPKVDDGETREHFLDRCMNNERVEAEYPDEDQRMAVCARQWVTKGAEPTRKGYVGKVDDIEREKRVMVVKIATDTVDRDGEVVLPGGIDIEAYDKNRVVMWAHQYDALPIAKSQWIKSSENGLVAKPQFQERTELAREIFDLYVDGYLNAWSIGFIAKAANMRPLEEKDLKKRPDWAGAHRLIEKSELLEYSAVPIPANPEALSLAISKGLSVPDSVKALIPEAIQEGGPWNREPRTSAEHEAVICDVEEFIPWTMRSVSGVIEGKTYINIVGRKKTDESQAVYAVRYPRGDWTADEAKKHAKENYSCGAFVPAARHVRTLQPPTPESAPRAAIRVLKPEPPKPAIIRVVGNTSEIADRVEARERGRVVWERE